MSLYSHGSDLRQAKTGLPFWRGDTRMEDPDERPGKAWGVGWTIPELDGADALLLAGVALGSSRWGAGCWIFCGVGCWI